VRRGRAREHRCRANDAREVGVVDVVELVPRQRPWLGRKGELAGNGRRRGGMVSGDHFHADAGRAAFPDCRANFLAGRIDEADKPDEGCAARDIRNGQVLLPFGEAFHRQGQHALALACDRLGLSAPLFGVQRRILLRAKLPVAHVQDLLRCALDESDAGAVFVAVMQRGHEAMLRIEGNLISPR